MPLPDPYHFDLGRKGGCGADQMDANCILVCDNVHLEKTSPDRPDDPAQSHLLLGGGDPLRGELVFTDCRLRPEVRAAGDTFYAVDSTLGTRFTNCTVHDPVVGGKPAPEAIGQTGFLEINGAVRHSHLNTALGNDVLHDLRARSIRLTAEFIAKLKCHHTLEG